MRRIIEKKVKPNLLSDIEILETIKEEYLEIIPKGCSDFFKKKRKSPSLPYLRKRFNLTYNQILIKVGIPEGNLKFVRKNRAEYISIIKNLYEKLGHTPSAIEFTDNGYSPIPMMKIFGSYNNSIKESGLTPNKCNSKVDLSKKEMLIEYKAFSNRIGKPASAKDLDYSKTMVSSGAYNLKFCGMNNLRKMAKFQEVQSGNKPIYNRKIISELLLKEYYKLKRHLTKVEINKNGNLPSSLTILKYFETTKLINVWAEIDKIIVERELLGKKIDYVNNKTEILKAGEIGEKKVSHYLSFLNLNEYIVYNNINIRVNGRSQQIDHLIIGINGIFRIETKNYSGEVNIDKNENWSKSNKYKYEMLDNPVGQIDRHEQLLKEALDGRYKIINVLVMANKYCKLSGLNNTLLNVIKVEKLLDFINSYKAKALINSKELINIEKCLNKYIDLIDNQVI